MITAITENKYVQQLLQSYENHSSAIVAIIATMIAEIDFSSIIYQTFFFQRSQQSVSDKRRDLEYMPGGINIKI